MSCASSTTAKSNGGCLPLAIADANAVNRPACVVSFRSFNPARTRSKMDHSTARCASGQPGLAAEAGDIAIRLPGFQLPGIHHLFPFGEKKMQAELVPAHGLRCFPSSSRTTSRLASFTGPTVRFVEA